MALLSNLFRDNRALQDCAVKDSAHITRGATGEHVAKIQFALFALDALIIDRTELLEQHYGRSTAEAVLAYKTKRKIINFSYQRTADDIVGKMTIASLDRDMIAHERVPKFPGDCIISPGRQRGRLSFADATNGFPQQTVSFAGPNFAKTLAPKRLGGFIRVFFQITLKSATEDGFPLSAQIEKARDCLSEHGITLFVEIKNGFADTLSFNERIISSFGNPADNIDQIRKASEDARPGLPGVFRVIVCQMVADVNGETCRNRMLGGKIVPPFALLNSQSVDISRATLIHEMIHASKDGPVDHDPEPASVFFKFGSNKPGSVERRFLKQEHALTLSRMSSKM